RNRLVAATGLKLPPTLVFDYPSAEAVTDYLLARVVPRGDDGEVDSEEVEFRKALALVPFSRLRDSGLMGALMELVRFDDDSLESVEGDGVERIDTMDIDDLVQQTLEGAPAEDDGNRR